MPFLASDKQQHHQREVEDAEFDCNHAELTRQRGSKSHNTKSHIQKYLPVRKQGEKSESELSLRCKDEDLCRGLKPRTEKGYGSKGLRTQVGRRKQTFKQNPKESGEN